jgi:hypothetical protein
MAGACAALHDQSPVAMAEVWAPRKWCLAQPLQKLMLRVSGSHVHRSRAPNQNRVQVTG